MGSTAQGLPLATYTLPQLLTAQSWKLGCLLGGWLLQGTISCWTSLLWTPPAPHRHSCSSALALRTLPSQLSRQKFREPHLLRRFFCPSTFIGFGCCHLLHCRLHCCVGVDDVLIVIYESIWELEAFILSLGAKFHVAVLRVEDNCNVIVFSFAWTNGMNRD